MQTSRVQAGRYADGESGLSISRALFAVSPTFRLTHSYADLPPYSKMDSYRRSRKCTDRQTEPGRQERGKKRKRPMYMQGSRYSLQGDLLSLCHPIPLMMNKQDHQDALSGRLLHWTTISYKSHVTEIKLVVSYQFLCAEHEYDSQNAKLALVFCNYNLIEIYVYVMHANNGLQLISVKRQVIYYFLDFVTRSCLLYSFLGASLKSVQHSSSNQPALALQWTIFPGILVPQLRYLEANVRHVHH